MYNVEKNIPLPMLCYNVETAKTIRLLNIIHAFCACGTLVHYTVAQRYESEIIIASIFINNMKEKKIKRFFNS